MANVIANACARAAQLGSDINEHIPTLRRYAAECSTVAEFGVRGITSTWAFLDGLVASPAETKRLICVDIDDIPRLGDVAALAQSAGVSLTFQHKDSVAADLDPGVDLLFIDTWHVYGHLKRELEAHHAKVRRYIAMHDTTIDGVRGESLRCCQDVQALMAQSGYSFADITTGLQPAIDEFLAAHPEWVVDAVYPNNNGLTVLRRVA